MIAKKIDLAKTVAKTRCSTPVFSFTPPAIKPAEMEGIKILIIELDRASPSINQDFLI